MKSNVVKFLCHTFFKLFKWNTEQFLFHGRIEESFVRNTEPTNDLMWKFFNKRTVAKSMINGVLFVTIYTVVVWQDTIILFVYTVLTISILIGQEPPAYFENSRDFVDKLDYSIICYPIISADYTARSAHA